MSKIYRQFLRLKEWCSALTFTEAWAPREAIGSNGVDLQCDIDFGRRGEEEISDFSTEEGSRKPKALNYITLRPTVKASDHLTRYHQAAVEASVIAHSCMKIVMLSSHQNSNGLRKACLKKFKQNRYDILKIIK